MEHEDYCDSLLVTEVFTPAGNWSAYPSHRHDEGDFPRIADLEETYNHNLEAIYSFTTCPLVQGRYRKQQSRGGR